MKLLSSWFSWTSVLSMSSSSGWIELSEFSFTSTGRPFAIRATIARFVGWSRTGWRTGWTLKPIRALTNVVVRACVIYGLFAASISSLMKEYLRWLSRGIATPRDGTGLPTVTLDWHRLYMYRVKGWTARKIQWDSWSSVMSTKKLLLPCSFLFASSCLAIRYWLPNFHFFMRQRAWLLNSG